jgi:hypothetical protein
MPGVNALVRLAEGDPSAWDPTATVGGGVEEDTEMSPYLKLHSELCVVKAVTALIMSNAEGVYTFFPQMAALLDMDTKLTTALMTLVLSSASVNENIHSVQDISRRLGVDPSIAAGFVVGNCNASLEELVEVLSPLCQGIGAEPKMCAAIVLGMSSAFAEVLEGNAVDFDYRVFVELCKYVYADPGTHRVVEAMGAIAGTVLFTVLYSLFTVLHSLFTVLHSLFSVLHSLFSVLHSLVLCTTPMAIAVAEEDVMEKNLLMISMRLGFFTEDELKRYHISKKKLAKIKYALIKVQSIVYPQYYPY